MKDIDLDLPLAEHGVSRFLQWIVAAATCLAVLALAVAALADAMVRRTALQPVVLTVALPAGTGTEALEATVALLERSEGVAFAEPVTEEELAQLVEPWLGEAGAAGALAMPRLIDVTFNPGFSPDVAALAARLQEAMPGAMLGESGGTELRKAETARSLRLLALIAALLFAALGVLAAAAVTRVSLASHAEAVDLLRLMGAVDRYVARQFEDYALRCGLRGGLAGFAAGVLVFVASIELGRRYGFAPFEGLALRPLDWVLLAMVPVVILLLVALVVRLVVGRRLARPV